MSGAATFIPILGASLFMRVVKLVATSWFLLTKRTAHFLRSTATSMWLLVDSLPQSALALTLMVAFLPSSSFSAARCLPSSWMHSGASLRFQLRRMALASAESFTFFRNFRRACRVSE